MPKIKMTKSRVVNGKPREKGKTYNLDEPFFSMVKNAGWGAPENTHPEQPPAEDQGGKPGKADAK
ncbi:MAG: hypothetical protein MI867_05860 [Pseudomonadales bacterium]|nr:hypothetical protein [Pseudomonadales bacterium]